MNKVKSILLLSLLALFLTANCAGNTDTSYTIAQEEDVIPSVYTQL